MGRECYSDNNSPLDLWVWLLNSNTLLRVIGICCCQRIVRSWSTVDTMRQFCTFPIDHNTFNHRCEMNHVFIRKFKACILSISLKLHINKKLILWPTYLEKAKQPLQQKRVTCYERCLTFSQWHILHLSRHIDSGLITRAVYGIEWKFD